MTYSLKEMKLLLDLHRVKSVRVRSYSGPHFSRIRTEYEEILGISPYSF